MMSHPEYLAPRVEITELMCILKVMRSAVFVITFPGYSIRFPPTVSLTLIGSYFCGHMSNMMREYVNVRPTGILLRATKQILFVPFSLSLEICLKVVRIPLTIRSARVLLFLFTFIA